MIFSSLYGERITRELSNADTTELFTTARRKQAINEGQEEFARLTKCLLRRSTVTVTGGTAEYDLNSTAIIAGGDFAEWAVETPVFTYTDASSEVTVQSGEDFLRRDITWLNRYDPGWQTSTISSGMVVPTVWYERFDGPARFMGLVPMPSTGSSASAKLTIPYVARPTPLTSDSQEPFMVNSSVRSDLRWYHQALVHYAAHQLEKLRPDPQASAQQLQRFLGYVTSYLQDTRIKGGTALTFARRYFVRGGKDDRKDPRT